MAGIPIETGEVWEAVSAVSRAGGKAKARDIFGCDADERPSYRAMRILYHAKEQDLLEQVGSKRGTAYRLTRKARRKLRAA